MAVANSTASMPDLTTILRRSSLPLVLSHDDPLLPTSPRTATRPSKRVSPGLELRLQRLDEQRRRRLLENRRVSHDIGRIPEEQLEALERLQQSQVVEIRRRGRTWTGPPIRVMPSQGGVRLSGGPAFSETEQSSGVLESDINSSPISLGTRLVPSDSEDEGDGFEDTQKYMMPDVGKTRLHLRTKEPLSPSPRRHTRTGSMRSVHSKRQSWCETPMTPTRRRGSPEKENSPRGSVHVNGSREDVSQSESDWVGSGLSRAGSIYSLSRVSFTGQLSQLTSMRLPDANSLAKRIASLATATEAAKALSDAADQILLWIGKATEVLAGLNAEDDVEWAAAGGREGMSEVDNAISRFEQLVQVYIMSIERLQIREDIELLSADELTASVKQLEGVIVAWKKIKETLKGVKEQVDVAMEWEELWNTVLGEIGQEMESLNRLVFEMEERRHEGAESLLSNRDSIDLNELETIVEEQPGRGKKAANRFSLLPPFSPSSPMQPAENPDNKENSSLLALFARMQPLRASLDFLPMRLSTFHVRGNAVFPTACEDLESRRDQLEELWTKLEGDAESLRRELGEDRWVLVFRNAGRQALKMCESISRSFGKLKEGIDSGEQQSNVPALSKKIENYEAKKTHYGPAIERVLSIIDKGVLDRLTVNGEVLRLQSDMKQRWSALQRDMRDMDLALEDITHDAREKQLRDSVSTVMSSERSIASSLVDTPGSSPASSVIGTGSIQGSRTPTPLISAKTRSSLTPSSARTSSSRIPSSSSLPRRTPLTRASASDLRSSPSPSPSVSLSVPLTTPPNPPGSASLPYWLRSSQQKPDPNRPRFVSLAKNESRDFAPLSKFEPSPYAKTPVTPKPYIPKRSVTPSTAPAAGRKTPLGRRNATEPVQQKQQYATLPRNFTARLASTPELSMTPPSNERKSSLPVPVVHNSPTSLPRPTSAFATKRPSSRLASAPSSARRASTFLPVPSDGNEADSEGKRPPSVQSGRRSSALVRSREEKEKPRWR